MKYFVLEQEPTTAQYAVSTQEPETVPQNPSKTKWLLKFDGDGIPSVFDGLQMFYHARFMMYANSSAWA